MSFGAVGVLALGLAIDATAVAAARGACAPRVRASDAVIVAMRFGGLYVLLPLVGSLGGLRAFARRALGSLDLVRPPGRDRLLVATGVKMIWSARRGSSSDACNAEPVSPFAPVSRVRHQHRRPGRRHHVATLGVSLVGAAATICGVTALACVGGLFAGHRFGVRMARSVRWFVLVAIGTKILAEHLASGR